MSSSKSVDNDNKWEELSAVPIMIDSEIVKLNNHEFIAAHRTLGLFKYNIVNDKWYSFVKYPLNSNYDLRQCKMLIDHKNNQIYISCLTIQDKDVLITYNIKTTTYNKYIDPYLNCETFFPSLVMINNKIHIINDQKQIGMWDNNKFKLLDQLDLKGLGITSCPYGKYGLIYLSSKQSMLFIGGCWYAYVWPPRMDDIYLYTLKERNITKIHNKLPLALSSFGYILTRNERYCIIFGGFGGTGPGNAVTIPKDDIYVFDVNMMTFKKSAIKCPSKDSFQALYYYNEKREEVITFGFIRRCWNRKSFKMLQFPPYYICKLIKQWVVQESVHLFAKTDMFNQKKHYKLNVDHIFNQLL